MRYDSYKAADWLLKCIHGLIERTEAANKGIPVMFQHSFKGEEYWSSRLPESVNVVIDVHIYYIVERQCDSNTVVAVSIGPYKTRLPFVRLLLY